MKKEIKEKTAKVANFIHKYHIDLAMIVGSSLYIGMRIQQAINNTGNVDIGITHDGKEVILNFYTDKLIGNGQNLYQSIFMTPENAEEGIRFIEEAIEDIRSGLV